MKYFLQVWWVSPQYTLTRRNGIRHTPIAPYRKYLNTIVGELKNSCPDVRDTKENQRRYVWY